MSIAIGESTYRLPNKQGHHITSPFKSIFDKDDLCREERRLRTFLLWPAWGKADVAKLALSGFFYTGEKDTAKCFECGVEISNWKDTEPPAVVHKRKSPHCPMVTKERSSNVPLHPEEASGSQSPSGGKGRRKGKKNPNSLDGIDAAYGLATDAVATNNMKSEASVFHSRPAPPASTHKASEAIGYTDMTKEENRIRSFEGKWPKSDIIKPIQMAKAGFWYKGPHDRVECAYCRGRLVNFVKGDDPVGEHARHFPSCQFIQELNNRPLSVLKWRSAKAVLMLDYSEAIVLTAINKCRMEGTEKPNTSQILDAIFSLEEERQKQVEEQMAAAGRIETDLSLGAGYLSSGLKSDELESEDLGSNVSNKSAPEVVKELRKKNEALKLSTTCKVCLNAEVNCVFLPCRHLVCCAECASKVEYCPVCRLQIIGTVKTFMA